MAKRKSALEADLLTAVKGIPELIILLGPVLTLWLLVLAMLYLMLFFIPDDWQWLAVHQVGASQHAYVHWHARTLLSLLLSFPVTVLLYLRLKK